MLLAMRLNQSIFLAIACVVAVFFLYWPGLYGDFMLDDHGNLPPLYSSMQLYGFWGAIFDGGSGPLGRPVSLWTFALQEAHWPTPYFYKLVNVFIHLLNAVLVVWVVRLVLPSLSHIVGVKYRWAPYIVGFVWAILPVHLSSVLYVIQRMTLLSSTFVLLGVLSYLYSRRYFVCQDYVRGYIGMFCGVGGSLFLGVFAKENALVLVLYLVVIETCLQRHSPIDNKLIRKSILLGLWAPMILFGMYIVYRWPSWENVWVLREFNVFERLFTQAIILVDYSKVVLLPIPSELGLYHDGYPISHGFFDPAKTIICFASIALALAAAYYAKCKKHYWVYFGVIWFFSGHVMESTVVPLELYFEHRNYLPSLSLVMMVVIGMTQLLERASQPRVRWMFVFLSVIYVAYLALITFGQSVLWGNTEAFQLVHAAERKNSVRAQSLLVSRFQLKGDEVRAYEQLLTLETQFPDELSIEFSKLEFGCYYPETLNYRPNLDQWTLKAATGRFSHATMKSMSDMIDYFGDSAEVVCDNFTAVELEVMIAAVLDNPSYLWRKKHINRVLSLLMFNIGNTEKALAYALGIDKASTEVRLYRARLQATMGNYDAAIAEIERALAEIGSGVKAKRMQRNADLLLEQLYEDQKLDK